MLKWAKIEDKQKYVVSKKGYAKNNLLIYFFRNRES